MAGPTLIFKWKGSGLKRRRSESERILQKEGWGSSLSEQQLDRLDFMERKAANRGREKPLFVKAKDIDTLDI